MHIIHKLFSLFFIGLMLLSCSRKRIELITPKVNEDAEDINAYIRGLNYEELINQSETSGVELGAKILNQRFNTGGVRLGESDKCQTIEYQEKQIFSEFLILNPDQKSLWPGALIKANDAMLGGAIPLANLPQAALNYSIDLPNTEKFTVLTPDATSVNERVKSNLQWWYDNAYIENYTNQNASAMDTVLAYNAEQLGLVTGLLPSWVSNSLAMELDYRSTKDQQVAYLFIKKAYYTVSTEPTENPADMLDIDVSLEQVKSAFSDENPAAYISSVTYGNLYMVRMVAPTSLLSALSSTKVLSYALNRDGDQLANEVYDKILQNASFHLIAIDADGQASTEKIELATVGALKDVLQQATHGLTKTNAGIPISYTAKYLKNHQPVTMAYVANYTDDSCIKVPYVHKKASVKNSSERLVRFRIKYQLQGTNTPAVGNWILVEPNKKEDLIPPNGSHSISIEIQYQKNGTYTFLAETNPDILSSGQCYEVSCKTGTNCSEVNIAGVSCL